MEITEGTTKSLSKYSTTPKPDYVVPSRKPIDDMGCNTCAHYRMGELNINRPDEPRRCLAGNSDKMDEWWFKNGGKKGAEPLTPMTCYTQTQHSQILDGISDFISELKALLQKN